MPYGEFFPRHDLMHYAVETTLGYREAFFGLINSGWSMESFGETGAAKRLPLEAKYTEFLVDQLEREHRFGERSNAEAFNATIADSIRQAGLPTHRPLLQKELDSIHVRFEELMARFNALPNGKRLELKWKPRTTSSETESAPPPL
jgi:hypothetical protein